MLFRNMFLKYYASADENGDGGAPSGGEPEITPEIQQLIDQRINSAVNGLKTKNSELLGTIKQQKDNLARFDGIDPDAVKTILQRFSDDEEAKLIAEGKIDDVLNKRTERLRADVDKQIKAANERAEKAEAFTKKFSDRVLGDAIRSAALKTGALPGAADDIILRARGTFTLNDDGEAVAIDGEGNPVLGKDGKTPLSPLEWAESLKETAPHLFPQAEGTGAGGHRSGAGGALKRSEMTSQQKADYIRKHGQQAFLRLPKE
ncbi:hypothetical protein IFU23_14070 [Pantoea agglomerans]|uniref:hypothetical protein n=1 Tax=Enterobacter agglomerans TaxID=549 RepID=UPI00177C6D9A|nr:hypothetical protein [Pantoea agglomerans]MBD8159227.1 hypothetical protein [Pantoea agglomerans]MBD8230309.1 hypothetical protein [Pantoea agglomerans]